MRDDKKAEFLTDDFSTSGQYPGTTLRVVYTERRMTVYGIEEQELDAIGDAHHNFTLWWSIASAAFALAGGCIWDVSLRVKIGHLFAG